MRGRVGGVGGGVVCSYTMLEGLEGSWGRKEEVPAETVHHADVQRRKWWDGITHGRVESVDSGRGGIGLKIEMVRHSAPSADS